MISTGPVEDRLMIRELIESYNDAVMRFDADDWADTWLDDATWALPGTGDGITGKDNFLPIWKNAMSAFEYVGFFAFPAPVTVTGDTAKGTLYQREELHQKDGVKRLVTGRYEDEYAKKDGRWYFSKRVYSVLQSEEV